MKRKIYILSISVLFAMTFLGCTEWLSTKPESEIILEEFWKTESDVQAVVAACYKRMTASDVVFRMIVWGELRSDNMSEGIGFPNESNYKDLGRILDGEITAYNDFSSWSAFYAVINYCNTILHYAPIVTERDRNFTQSDLIRTQAEVRSIRALAYFYLVRAYKEVPWIEDASISDTQNYDKAKDTEQTVIGHIIDDLIFARQNIAVDYGRKDYNKGRMTRNAVNALLADVYLWNQQYDESIAACDSVLADKNLELEKGTFAFSRNFYVGNSNESIFELQFDDNISIVNTAVQKMYGTSNDFGFISLPTTLADNPYNLEADKRTGLYSPFNYKVSSILVESSNDERAKDSYREYSGKYYIFKYVGINRTENQTGSAGSVYFSRTNTPDWIIYRLSDVILMKAEALVQKNNYAGAMEMVNLTYLRSNPEAAKLEVSDYPTQGDMELLVLRERQRELLFEGKRWFDLLRVARREGNTNTINNYVDHKASGATATLGVPVLDALYMPIKDSELRSNPKLEQNVYYKTTSSSNR
ncbi:MAG: RagB/SusD family nutrient uptake outer membrane protein [Paludibacteraceae bacterium]